MAGDWIKMRVNLWTHPKVVTLASRLGVTRAHLIGALHGAWSIADQHADEDGTVDMTETAIDILVETPGFCSALESVGWVEVHNGSLQFLNYQEHNGTTAKTRAGAAKRKRKSREGVTNVTVERDKSVTREEKRREEKNNTPYSPPKGDDTKSKKKQKQAIEYTASFEEFWEACPKREGKLKAFQSWEKAKPIALKSSKRSQSESVEDFLCRRMRDYSATVASREREFIKHPATWLNQGCWDDETKSRVATAEQLASWTGSG